jgi:DNA polymerase-3 subunit gamma/tau
MVNCEEGPTPEPCGVCGQCVSIREGQHLDVVEIDAASHGGVDDARDLREKAPTSPVQGREKVYIIDEAQRLSREAFDALLKVFEEPPVGVRFVLATTEPHKMPPTIIGRCQRFDFRRVPTETVAEHLLRIAKDEGMTLSPAAAHAIARQAEGSVRDALSLLDQASVLGAGEVGEDVVGSLIGSGDTDVQYALADAISVGDGRGMFEVVERMVQEGRDLRHVTNEALEHYRNLLVVKTAPEEHDLLDVTEAEGARLRAQAEKFTAAEISRIIALLLQAQADMRWTTSPRLSLELALIRATLPQTDVQPQALVSRLERLERLAGVASPAAGAQVEAPGALEAPAGADGVPREAPAERDEVPAETEAIGTAEPALGGGRAAVDVTTLRTSWGTLLQRLRGSGKAVLPSLLEIATPTAFDGETLELVFPPDRRFGVAKVQEREQELRDALRELFGITPRIRCVVRESVVQVAETIDEDPPLSEEEALAKLAAELGARPSPEGS